MPVIVPFLAASGGRPAGAVPRGSCGLAGVACCAQSGLFRPDRLASIARTYRITDEMKWPDAARHVNLAKAPDREVNLAEGRKTDRKNVSDKV